MTRAESPRGYRRRRVLGAGLALAATAALRDRVMKTITVLCTIAPGTGTYVNECDYFQENWQGAFWGANYERLVRIKQRYDPDGLFVVHHGVGSRT